MPEWLKDSFPNGLDMPLDQLGFRLGASLVLGCAVAGIYHLTRRKAAGDSPSLVATLVLLTVLICMVTLVIGNSVARAFSLVGALAIVRFRTVVEDTRDTAFVIFAVAVGMAVGAGFLAVTLVGLPVAAAAAFLFRPRKSRYLPASCVRLLTVRLGTGHDPDALLRKVFDAHLEHWDLTAAITSRQGAAIDLSYAVRLRREGATVALVVELNKLEGVQSVELRQP
jgi:uncharacterized membrane protein YhiD involved in acid resistance